MQEIDFQTENYNTQLPIKTDSFTFMNDNEGYINNRYLFYSYFKKIPNIQTLSNINLYKAKKYIEVEFEQQIITTHRKKLYIDKTKENKNKDYFFVLKDEIIINLYCDCVDILFSQVNIELPYQIFTKLKRFKNRERTRNDISLITPTSIGLTTTEIKIKKPKLHLETHYNDDLLPLHKLIMQQLKRRDKSSLYLFHGKPGTGKSTYIRYLIHQQKKEVIFMPPKLASNLEQPDFTSFIIRNANTVFIIEDAEELIVSREGTTNSKISMLLNLTDGLLGEALGIQIIATFNTSVFNIDKALLRKGRLSGIYEFKPLTVEKSTTLLESLGIKDFPVSTPMTLSEIFNTESISYNYNDEKRSIGFLHN